MVIKLKILFISDIHGICNNLEYIDKVIQTEKINKLVVLGDLYYCDQVYINDDKYWASFCCFCRNNGIKSVCVHATAFGKMFHKESKDN